MKLTEIPIEQRPFELHQAYTATLNMTVSQVAEQFGCGISTVYRHLATYRQNGHASQGPNPPAPTPAPSSTEAVPPPRQPTVAEVLEELGPTRRPGHALVLPSENRSCVLDIETSDFSATGLTGFLICAVILPLGADQPVILSLENGEQHGDDKRLLQATIQALNEFDNIIGHYILGFDLPWLYTRADLHGLPPLRAWAVLDTYHMARDQKLKTIRKSQAFLLDHFGMENLKTSVYPRLWDDVRSNNASLFRYSRDAIVDHCVKDVIGNRLLFDRLYPKAFATYRCPYRMTPWKGAAYRPAEASAVA